MGLADTSHRPQWAAAETWHADPLAAPDTAEVGLSCAGQLMSVPRGRYDWIQLRFAPSGEDTSALEEEVWLHYADAVDLEWLRGLPDGTARVPITRPGPLVRWRLPVRPALRLLAVTLAGRGECPSPGPGNGHGDREATR